MKLGMGLMLSAKETENLTGRPSVSSIMGRKYKNSLYRKTRWSRSGELKKGGSLNTKREKTKSEYMLESVSYPRIT